MFIVTKEWIDNNKTKKGGYTAAQGRVFNMYPFRTGWKKALIGREITLAQKSAFEAASGLTGKTKKGKGRPSDVQKTIFKIQSHSEDEQRVIFHWLSEKLITESEDLESEILESLPVNF